MVWKQETWVGWAAKLSRNGHYRLSDSLILCHQLGVQRFNSIWHYWEVSIRSHRCKDSVPDDHPHFKHQLQMEYQDAHTSNLAINTGITIPPFQFWYFARTVHRTQENAVLIISVHYKGYKWTAGWRGNTRQGPEESWVQEPLSVRVGVHQPPGTCMCSPT